MDVYWLGVFQGLEFLKGSSWLPVGDGGIHPLIVLICSTADVDTAVCVCVSV